MTIFCHRMAVGSGGRQGFCSVGRSLLLVPFILPRRAISCKEVLDGRAVGSRCSPAATTGFADGLTEIALPAFQHHSIRPLCLKAGLGSWQRRWLLGRGVTLPRTLTPWLAVRCEEDAFQLRLAVVIARDVPPASIIEGGEGPRVEEMICAASLT